MVNFSRAATAAVSPQPIPMPGVTPAQTQFCLMVLQAEAEGQLLRPEKTPQDGLCSVSCEYSVDIPNQEHLRMSIL